MLTGSTLLLVRDGHIILVKNWHFRLRGDIGGLGLSSDFTGTTSAGIIYVINDLMDIDLTYKATGLIMKKAQNTPLTTSNMTL